MRDARHPFDRRWLAGFAAFLVFWLSLTGNAGASEIRQADGWRTEYLEYRGEAGACAPLAILSPGRIGTPNRLERLALSLADRGFHVFAMGHPVHGKQNTTAKDARAMRARIRDLDAVWQMATAECHPDFTLMVGHSRGGRTAMAEAGVEAVNDVKGQDRFDAYVVLSPRGIGEHYRPGAWAGIEKPVLMVTGTEDNGGEGSWRIRVTAFDGMPAGRKRLAVVEGASHKFLSGRGSGDIPGRVIAVVLAWLDDLGPDGLAEPAPLPGVTYRQK